MYLKRIEIYGFKSFAQKSVLDFEYKKTENITAIVGPNGSGKSNIADAIRWVTGEQSGKNLRSKKSEDIIFSGSAVKSRGSYAEVSLVLANDRLFKFELNGKIYEMTEIEVSRKLYRSGDSEYLINHKKVRLFDVQQLLASLGFGQSSYTVIGQGMVDRLLFFTAAERKVLFDEAAGVKQYEIKREQAIRKLESTDSNLIRLSDILSELEPRVANLRRLVKRAEGRKEFEAELATVQERYFGSLLSEYQGLLLESNSSKNDLNKKIVQFNNNIEKLEQKISSEKNNPFSKERQILENKVIHSTEVRDSLMREVSYLTGQAESVSQNINTLLAKKAQFTIELQSHKDKLSFLTDKVKREKNQILALSASSKDLRKAIDIQEKEISDLDINLEKPTLSKDLARAAELETLLANLNNSKQEFSGKLYNIRQEESYNRLKLEQNERKISEEINNLNSLKEKISAAKDADKRRLETVRSMSLQLAGKKTQLEALEQKILTNEELVQELATQVDSTNLTRLETEMGIVRKTQIAIADRFSSVKNFEEFGPLRVEFVNFVSVLNKLFERFQGVTRAVSNTERGKLEATISSLRRDSAALSHEISVAEVSLAKLESETSSARTILVELCSRTEEKEAAIADLRLSGLQSTDPSLEKSLNEQLAKVSKEITSLEIEHKKYLGLVSEHQNAILKQKSVLQEKIAESRAQMHEIELRESRQKSILDNQEAEIETTKRQISKLTESLELMAREEASGNNSELKSNLVAKEKELDKQEEDLAKYRGGLSQAISKEREFEQANLGLEREKRQLLDEKNAIIAQLAEIELETAKTQVRYEDLKEEIKIGNINLAPSDKFSYLDQMEKDVMKIKMENIRRKLETIGGVDPETEAEYMELDSRATEMSTQVTDLTRAKADLTRVIGELDERIKRQFEDVFKNISSEFSRYFSMLFNGGNADLKLGEDEEGRFGIEISANPPGKRAQSLNALSGGERTLTSLALLFAILSVNPSPFCVLDEVDAALDESNTLRFVKILADLATKTQFIIISHNRDTMKVAGTLYGVTMNEEHISKMLSVKLTDALVAAK